MITVRDLIKELQRLDPDTPIVTGIVSSFVDRLPRYRDVEDIDEVVAALVHLTTRVRRRDYQYRKVGVWRDWQADSAVLRVVCIDDI